MRYLDALEPLRAWLTRPSRRPAARPARPRFRPTVQSLEERNLLSNVPPSFDFIPDQTVAKNSGTHTITITNIKPGPLPDEELQGISIHVAGDSGVISNFTFGAFSPQSGYPASIPLNYTLGTNQSGTCHVTVSVDDTGPNGGADVNHFQQTFTVQVPNVGGLGGTGNVAFIGSQFQFNRRNPLKSKLFLNFSGAFSLGQNAFEVKLGRKTFKVRAVSTPGNGTTSVTLSLKPGQGSIPKFFTSLKLIVHGDKIILADGSAFDADNNGVPGGTATFSIPLF